MALLEKFSSGSKTNFLIENHFVIKDKSSNCHHFVDGLPQGSVLGAVIFPFYVNDIKEA